MDSGKFPQVRIRLHKAPSVAVGYKQPPKEHQFKPGASGNPSGKRKEAKTSATILEKFMNRKIRLRGQAGQITVHEAIFLRFADEALKGDVSSATFILKRYVPVEAKDISRAARNARIAAIPIIDSKMSSKQAEEIYAETLRVMRDWRAFEDDD
ncbi:MAG: DUF5681 domain-containing protein [Variibacter sp.]